MEESMKDYEKELEESYRQLEEDDVAASRTEEDEAKALLWGEFKEMMEQKTPVEVKIKEAVPKGVVAYLNDVRAFIPVSQITDGYVEKTDDWVGKRIHVQVIEVDKEKERLVLSGKAVAAEKAAKEREEKKKALSVGDVLDGKVETIQPYGAFVDLGGITGLVHVSQVCQKRIKTPAEVLKVGQSVKVKIQKIEGDRISLSMKALQDPGSDDMPVHSDASAEKYSDHEEVGTSLGSLLKGIKLEG